MTGPSGTSRRVLPGLLAAVTAAALSAGCVSSTIDAHLAPSPHTHRDPVALDIPAIDVHTALLRLGIDGRGAVEVPPLESGEAGWYVHSPAPGEKGPAVLLGHVDSARSGPSVFYHLKDLGPADMIMVRREDGTVVTFRVERVVRYPKSAFPSAEVYGDLDHPGLRLITCGGAFDETARSYRDNVVVFASVAAR